MELFGISFGKDKEDKKIKRNEPVLKAFEIEDTSATDVLAYGNGGVIAYDYNSSTVPNNEVELIENYRSLAKYAEVDLAIQEIQNEFLVHDVPNKKAIELDFKDTSKISDNIKKKINEEYDNIYSILDFKSIGNQLFYDWYVDGKLFLHKIIDDENPKNGIQKVIQIDPCKIKKIRVIPQKDRTGITDINKILEYYIYVPSVDNIFRANETELGNGLRINAEAISYIDSNLYDKKMKMVIGDLNKVLIPYNNLRLMEESLLIYRVSRAPERRVIYVDVGNLPKQTAEQYVQNLMNRFKNKLVYDSKTGSVLDRKNILSMVEDYWLPRRDGKGTEIDTLPGGENLGVTTDVEYFRNIFYKTLNVPFSRFSLDQSSAFVFGRAAEIARDEFRFKKFINKKRQQFVELFFDILRTQLILKGIITEIEWDSISRDIQWIFTEDNNYIQYKETELLNSKLETLAAIDPFVGKYVDKDFVLKTIFRFTDEQIKNMNITTPEEDAKAAADMESGNF
ncbi:MAG: portal protein [Flavobacterium sp.]|uniref:portal protein n=1 Tax=Flavobacterium sp. TaxID=239 RepID=UPI0026081653|nr:portal protein [Flavobacterium sp.]MDD5150601.1 portal protein [Flavobacterium sp.]